MLKSETTNVEDTICAALLAKGYGTVSEHRVNDHSVQAFRLYTNGRHVLCLQIYKSGGVELYLPVSDTPGVADTINSIP